MPEGPELHLSALYINRICKDKIFSGKIIRNPIHKSEDIVWNHSQYTIDARSKGKELMLYLYPSQINSLDKDKTPGTSILFRFGMSGKFCYTPADELEKHSHLQFFTKDEPKMALSFVDYRRFGRWFQGESWSVERGPCVIQEFQPFVKNIADNLNTTAFDKPICEVLLNQKFFNGIGNYLRAEVLFRCKTPPFELARTALKLKEAIIIKTEIGHLEAAVKVENNAPVNDIKTHSKKRKHQVPKEEEFVPCKTIKAETVDDKDSSDNFLIETFDVKAQEILRLCHSIPHEVIQIGCKKNSLNEMYYDDTDSSFNTWLQCYSQPGMKNMVDHNKRTIWFCGPSGSMVPKEQKQRSHKSKANKTVEDIKSKEQDSAKKKIHKSKTKITDEDIKSQERDSVQKKRNHKSKTKKAGEDIKSQEKDSLKSNSSETQRPKRYPTRTRKETREESY